jgi:outer membrane protein insertion porin family
MASYPTYAGVSYSNLQSLMKNYFIYIISLFTLTIFESICFPSPASGNGSAKAGVIHKIEVEGNNFFSTSKIKDQMILKENKWFNIFKKRRFSPKKAEMDQFAIDSLYHVNGFLDAECKIEGVEEKKNKVMVDIKEGIQTKLSHISSSGGLPEFEEKVKKEIKILKIGDPFNQVKLNEVAFNIKTVYANNGYPYADIRMLVTPSEDKSQAEVTFKIDEDKKVYFGEVSYKGLKRTKENVAKRELTIKKGEVYSRAKIIDSEQRLFSTELFNYVTLDALEAQKKPQNPDFTLRAVEKKPNYIGVRTELAQNRPQTQNQQEYLTADFTGEWGNRNLAGTARKIGLSAYYSYKILPKIERLSNRFTVGYVEPWFLGTRTVLNLDLYYEPGVKSAVQKYRIESYGGNLNFSREYKKYTKIWFTQSYEQVNIYHIPPEELETYKREKGINVRRKLILSGEKDTRDNIFVPIKGSFTQVSTEYVGGFLGGDNNFFKLVLSWSRYNPLGKRNILNLLATRLKFGYMEGLGRKDYVPTFDRFYMGGASTVRGYVENSMGPRDESGTPTGGKILLLGNLEYRRALLWKFGYTIFIDAGNIWSGAKYIKTKDIKLTSGMGIQFFTPVGPLRLDYGRQLPIKKSPQTGRFHLSILYAF